MSSHLTVPGDVLFYLRQLITPATAPLPDPDELLATLGAMAGTAMRAGLAPGEFTAWDPPALLAGLSVLGVQPHDDHEVLVAKSPDVPLRRVDAALRPAGRGSEVIGVRIIDQATPASDPVAFRYDETAPGASVLQWFFSHRRRRRPNIAAERSPQGSWRGVLRVRYETGEQLELEPGQLVIFAPIDHAGRPRLYRDGFTVEFLEPVYMCLRDIQAPTPNVIFARLAESLTGGNTPAESGRPDSRLRPAH